MQPRATGKGRRKEMGLASVIRRESVQARLAKNTLTKPPAMVLVLRASLAPARATPRRWAKVRPASSTQTTKPAAAKERRRKMARVFAGAACTELDLHAASTPMLQRAMAKASHRTMARASVQTLQ